MPLSFLLRYDESPVFFSPLLLTRDHGAIKRGKGGGVWENRTNSPRGIWIHAWWPYRRVFTLPGQRVAEFNIQSGLYLYVWESLGDPSRCLSGRTEFPGGCLTVFHFNSPPTLRAARLNEGEKKCRREEWLHMIVSERVRRALIFVGAPEPGC